MTQEKKTAILYIRTSTNDQQNSVDLQCKSLMEYCERNNIEILKLGIFKDIGRSGKETKTREEFTRMMELIKKSDLKPADMVLVTKLDRFARSTFDLLANLNILIEKGMQLNTLDMSFDTSTPIGKLMVQLLAMIAEFERSLINERTREGFKAAVEKGEKLCHRPRKEVSKKRVFENLELGLSATAISKIEGVSANTMKYRLNEWGYEYRDGKWKLRENR
jgi:DNA invertase Pin-like site-specific DNA recombinase